MNKKIQDAAELNEQQAKKLLVLKVEKKLLQIVRLANLEQFRQHGTVNYSARHGLNGKCALSTSICEKFLVQHLKTEQSDEGADFHLTYIALGKLGEILSKYKANAKFELSLTNQSGDDSAEIFDEKGVDDFLRLHLSYDLGFQSQSLELIQIFVEELESFFVFHFIKIS